MSFQYDLYVIGAGSGGVRASRMSAARGARVAVAESTYLGGTCVNVGCVPKKLFVYGSHFAEEFEDAAGFGWQVGERSFHWPTLRDNKTAEIERLNGIYQGLLDGAGVDTHIGQAKLLDAHTVEVAGQQYTAENILIATGSRPWVPDFDGRDQVITSNEAFYLEQFPERAVVVGGGYIAVEFAGIFAGLGAETHLVYRGPLFLRGFDEGIRQFVRDELAKKHIHLHFEENVERVSDDRTVHLTSGATIAADTVLYATGRRPNTEGLGLENAGVALNEAGAIAVDDYFQTSTPNIYAIGDVIDRFQLTPVAISEGMCIAHNLFGEGEKRKQDYDNIATAVFCQPNIGTVGLTEEEARSRYDIEVYESTFRPMKHTLSGRDERTLMKLIVRREDDVVVGLHMAGPDAGEIVQGMAVAMKAGATKADFDATVGIHPTAAEEFVTMREPVR